MPTLGDARVERLELALRQDPTETHRRVRRQIQNEVDPALRTRALKTRLRGIEAACLRAQGRTAEADRRAREALDQAEHPRVVAELRGRLAMICLDRMRLNEAALWANQAIEAAFQDRLDTVARSLVVLAIIENGRDHPVASRSAYTLALDHFDHQVPGSQRYHHAALVNLGLLEAAGHELEAAELRLGQARRLDASLQRSECPRLEAAIAAAQGDWDRAIAAQEVVATQVMAPTAQAGESLYLTELLFRAGRIQEGAAIAKTMAALLDRLDDDYSVSVVTELVRRSLAGSLATEMVAKARKALSPKARHSRAHVRSDPLRNR